MLELERTGMIVLEKANEHLMMPGLSSHSLQTIRRLTKIASALACLLREYLRQNPNCLVRLVISSLVITILAPEPTETIRDLANGALVKEIAFWLMREKRKTDIIISWCSREKGRP
jgi:hypothetical protein